MRTRFFDAPRYPFDPVAIGIGARSAPYGRSPQGTALSRGIGGGLLQCQGFRSRQSREGEGVEQEAWQILIVEDDQRLAQLTREYLEGNGLRVEFSGALPLTDGGLALSATISRREQQGEENVLFIG